MKTIINQNQTGLLIRNGRIKTTLPAGAYKTYGFRNETVLVYPKYQQSLTFAISARTAEGAIATIDTTMGTLVNDVKYLFLSGKTLPEIVLQAVTKQLQNSVEKRTLNELLEGNLDIDETALNKEITHCGLTVAVELPPRIRLSRSLQNAIDAQEVARQRAKAELEEARGRSAVIRHYANVAKVTKDNPDLLRLLLGQKAKSINVAFDAAERSVK